MNSILADVKPVVWVKWKTRDPQVAPLSRSGHTLTQFGGKILLFGGTINGLEDPNVKKVGPANDLWLLDIFQKNIFNDVFSKIRNPVYPSKKSNNL